MKKDIEIERLSNLVNQLKDELAEKQRGYIFRPEKLTEADQLILARNVDNELIVLLKKLFKIKADENADLLLHFPAETEAKRVGWSIAIRMYDDLVMQLDRSENILKNKEALKRAKEKYN